MGAVDEGILIHKCQSCGGIMEFDIKSQQLMCPNCSTVGVIESDGSVDEHVFCFEELQKSRTKWNSEASVAVCGGCGAEITVPEDVTSVECAYCGTAHVLEKKQLSGIMPEAVIPFKIDKPSANEIFRKWLKSRFFAPKAAKNLYQQDKLHAVYTPYWTYDAHTTSPYSAQGGKVYYVTVGSGDNKKTQRRVNWYPVRGCIDKFFDDVRVCAGKQNINLIERVDEFDVSSMQAFSTAYLSGFSAEKYSLEPEDGYLIAQQKMRDSIESDIRSEVLRSFDEVRAISFDTTYSNVMFKHVLFPIYSSGFRFKEKIYSFVISGLTGRIAGKYPLSPIKVALAVLVGLIVVGAFVFVVYKLN